jgi:gas vesicle protein
VINLRKPLEGIPGLLLLAALVLFGATIGVSLALLWNLVPMKDSLANFLGGVVGAGLGAALAVFGSVYLQREQRRAELTKSANSMRSLLEDIEGAMERLADRLPMASPPDAGYVPMLQEQIAELSDLVKSMPAFYEFPAVVHDPLKSLRNAISRRTVMMRRVLNLYAEGKVDKAFYDDGVARFRSVVPSIGVFVRAFLERLDLSNVAPTPEAYAAVRRKR